MRVDGFNDPFVALVFEEWSFFAFELITFDKKTSVGLFEFLEKISVEMMILKICDRFVDEEGLGIFEFVGFEFDSALYDF